MNFLATSGALAGIIALVLYIASALLLYRAVFAVPAVTLPPNESTSRPAVVWATAIAAALFHALMLVSSTFSNTGINLDFLNALSVTAWFTIAITLLLNTGRPVINLGLILFPASALILMLRLMVGTNPATVTRELQIHVLVSFIAYALLTIAAGQSVLVSLQDKRLHERRPGGFLRALPPLKVMETVLFQLLIASFLMLSMALLSGFVWLDDLFAQRLVHKTTLSIVAWLILGILLLGQWRWGWRGQKAAAMTIGAFISLLLAYFGSKFVIEIVLG